MTRAIAVVDLGFGDAGKGILTDCIARRTGARLVVRFNGGAQAGHNVVTSDGRHHTFAQFGSASLIAGTRTHLTRDVVVHPTALLVEAARLAEIGVSNALDRISVSEDALVVTPLHQSASRLHELARGEHRHGSCGVGIGETVRGALERPKEAIRVRHLRDAKSLRDRVHDVQNELRSQVHHLHFDRKIAAIARTELAMFDADAPLDAWIEATRPFANRVAIVPDSILRDHFRAAHPVIFEGAQGVLLDEWHGFHPFTTWSTCTFANVVRLLEELGHDEPIVRLGVLRTYAHRHGPGPLPTEAHELAAALVEPHNQDGPWQGAFRSGWPDFVLVRYAIEACGGIDALALTHMDARRKIREWRVCAEYRDGDRAIDRIAVNHARDLSAASARTSLAFGARPRYESLPATTSESAWIDRYAREVGAKVAFTSTGPTAEDVCGGVDLTPV